jgi:hypothetical protein
MFEIDSTDQNLVGLSTPDSLTFSFRRKKSAHAGGSIKFVDRDQVLQNWLVR